jgi:hypothetical protein
VVETNCSISRNLELCSVTFSYADTSIETFVEKRRFGEEPECYVFVAKIINIEYSLSYALEVSTFLSFHYGCLWSVQFAM